ncbi:unnamed protein product [Rotaria magnacalcarata]
MSRLDHQSKRNLLRRLPIVRCGMLLLWIEDSCLPLSLSDKSKETITRINDLHKYHMIRYASTSKCIRYLKQARIYERIIIIMAINKIAVANISQFAKYEQIKFILIVAPNNNNNDNVLSETIVKTYLFSDHESMFVKLQLLAEENQQAIDSNIFTTFDPNGRSLRDVHQHLGPFVWSHSYIAIPMSMPCNTRYAKRQMLTELRRHPTYYQNNAQLKKISEFERHYRSADAISWYTKESFLHTMINEALRTEDPRVLYIYRFYINDLCRRLEETSALNRELDKSPFRVYRGAIIDQDEVEKLRVGMLVGSNGFFSSSRRLEVAKMFIGLDLNTGMLSSQSQTDGRQFVLFEINVDPTQTADLIIADVSRQSNYPEEEEVLFGLGTTFIIKQVTHDSQYNVWNVGMVTSSEMSELKIEYTIRVEKGLRHYDAMTIFGIQLSEMSSNYRAGITHLQTHLRNMAFDDPYRASVYYSLARAYRYLGKHQLAVEYFRRAMLLQKQSLSQSNYALADTLADLGTTFSQMNDITKAVSLQERAISLLRRILGPNHIDMPLYYTQLAYVYWQEKQYEKAHSLLLTALSILKDNKTSKFSGITFTMHTIGLVKYAMGQQEEAINFLKEALELRRKLFADDHPSVAQACYSLAVIYMNKDEKQVAFDYAQKAITIYQAKLPKDHADLKKSIELVERILSFQRDSTFLDSNVGCVRE